VSFKFRDNIERLAGYVPGFQPADKSVIKINTNENPYPPSPKVFEALAALDGEAFRRYPPIYWDAFREAASKIHGIDTEMIIAGNGGDELISIIVRCCCDKNRPLAYPIPTYSLYPVLAAIEDAPAIEVPYPDDCSIPEALVQTEAPLTILCNPNAPTCTFVPVDEIEKLARQVKGVLLIDEAYVDFADDNCLRLLKDNDNLLILRSLSKGYSLAGMRFGYAMGSPRIIETMMKVKDSYNVNIATQVAATAAIQDQQYFQENTQKIIYERQRLIPALRELGFQAGDSQTNFILAEITTPPARQVYEKLIEKNIYIRYFNKQGMTNKLRITVGTAEQNDTLLAALREIL
jgi:histidinol-phosphate aminotransferase